MSRELLIQFRAWLQAEMQVVVQETTAAVSMQLRGSYTRQGPSQTELAEHEFQKLLKILTDQE